MQERFHIKKVAVLGAGVMGAQIAAHCVNAGFQTLLFDLPAKEGDANAIVNKAVANLAKLKPSPIGTKETLSLLAIKNYQDNLDALKTCDLVIEAIAERLDWKEALYQQVCPHLKKDAILVTNTSGLSINQLSETLPSEIRSRFCGVHFFNPPRYMHLAELIPSTFTSEHLLNQLETWLTRYLGKGVVRAKDTPNFIANRIGVFSLLSTLHHAQAMNLGFDEVDALTGVLIGRPKSATFRTMDVVGLDTLKHVVDTMHQQLEDDPWHRLFSLPNWLRDLISNQHLGQKTGQGIYRKVGKTIEVYDLDTNTYRPVKGQVDEEVKAILHEKDPHERMRRLWKSTNRQAQFLKACFRDLFHYSAFQLEAIADNVRDVDLAMQWGFGWAHGPFESWQAGNVEALKSLIKEDIDAGQTMVKASLPSWLEGLSNFYNDEGAYSPSRKTFVPVSSLAVYQRQYFRDGVAQKHTNNTKILFENDGLKVWALKEEVAVAQFKTKANTINQAVIDGLNETVDLVEKQYSGLIIYQDDAQNFSSGADLKGVYQLLQEGNIKALEKMIEDFQAVNMRIKYSVAPVVAALRGRALGGGCELLLHMDAIVAGFESYPGLVEAGVGLIPAGGGCKEMALRCAMHATKTDLMTYVQAAFEQIAMATVATSAPDAARLGYLQAQDNWLMHSHEVLLAAFNQVKHLQANNYLPPIPKLFSVAGREGHARLQIGLQNWLKGGFISQHDYDLANHLAFVLCGGDVNEGQLVDEQWILKLEKDAFMALAQTPLTQARIKHLLDTGKPLRN